MLNKQKDTDLDITLSDIFVDRIKSAREALELLRDVYNYRHIQKELNDISRILFGDIIFDEFIENNSLCLKCHGWKQNCKHK